VSEKGVHILAEWLPIDGFDYEASDTGFIRNQSGRILKGRPTKRGHLRVQLRRDGVSKEMLISRLVATCFLPNPEQLSMVRHKDFCRSNNAVSNLEWCDHKENIALAVEAGRLDALISPTRAKRLTASLAEKAYAMRLTGKSFKAIALALNISAEAAMNVCHGVAWRDDARPSLSRRA
jgi:hypothetical protein